MGQTHQKSERIEKFIYDKLFLIDENINFKSEELKTIQKMTALQLQEHLLQNQNFYTFPQVFRIFHQLKQQNNNKHNTFADIFFKKPLKKSIELEILKKTKELSKSKYPLSGFFFSIKDSLIYQNSSSTCGFKININKTFDQNPPTITLLEQKGAIITCKGNVPQTLYAMESFNDIFGNTMNPYNIERTSGGSSGGDAAMVSLGLVNCAIGSDIAGSLRIPGLFCGVVAFKPTPNRVSNDLFATYFQQHEFDKGLKAQKGIIEPVIGPICKSVADCEEIMKVLVLSQEWNFRVPPLEWKKVEMPKKIGLMIPIIKLPVCQSQLRAMRIVKNILESKNIEIVEINLNEYFEEIVITTMATLMKNKKLIQVLKGKVKIKEKIIPQMENFVKLLKTPISVLKTVLQLKDGTRKALYMKARILESSENEDYLIKRIDKLYNIFRNIMKDKDVDVLISPGLVTPAVKHLTSKDCSLQGFYTYIFNLFSMPSGALPVTQVKKDEQFYQDSINDELTKCFQNNLIGAEGLPIGVIVSGMPWKDELVLKVMKEIEKEIQFEMDPYDNEENKQLYQLIKVVIKDLKTVNIIDKVHQKEP